MSSEFRPAVKTDRSDSWFEKDLPEELAQIDLSEADNYQLNVDLAPGDRLIGHVNDREKRWFLLYIAYVAAAEETKNSTAKVIFKFRAQCLLRMFVMFVQERFVLSDFDLEDFNVKRGWQIVVEDPVRRAEKIRNDQLLRKQKRDHLEM